MLLKTPGKTTHSLAMRRSFPRWAQWLGCCVILLSTSTGFAASETHPKLNAGGVCPSVPTEREDNAIARTLFNESSHRISFDYEDQYLNEYLTTKDDPQNPDVAGGVDVGPDEKFLDRLFKDNKADRETCKAAWTPGFRVGAGHPGIQDMNFPYSISESCSGYAKEGDNAKADHHKTSIKWACCRKGFLSGRHKLVKAINIGRANGKLQNCAADYDEGASIAKTYCNNHCPSYPASRTAYPACWGTGFDKGLVDCFDNRTGNEGKRGRHVFFLGLSRNSERNKETTRYSKPDEEIYRLRAIFRERRKAGDASK